MDMRKTLLFICFGLIGLATISGEIFAQQGVWKCGNDACISKDIVEMIRDYSKEQPIYIAYDGNGWCLNQNNLGKKLIPDGAIFRATGLAYQDFNIFQLPDGRYPRDYANGINCSKT